MSDNKGDKWLLGVAGTTRDHDAIKRLAEEFVAYLRQLGHHISFSTFHHGEATPLAILDSVTPTSPGTTVGTPPPEPGKPTVHPTPPPGTHFDSQGHATHPSDRKESQ